MQLAMTQLHVFLRNGVLVAVSIRKLGASIKAVGSSHSSNGQEEDQGQEASQGGEVP